MLQLKNIWSALMICMTNLFMFETPDSKGLGTWVTESITAPIRVPHVFFLVNEFPTFQREENGSMGLNTSSHPRELPLEETCYYL